MSDPPSYDQTLLDRLNALKKSSVHFDSSKQNNLTEVPKRSTPETDLSERLRSLRNATASVSPALPKSPQPIQSSPAPSQPVTEDADPILTSLSSDDKTLDELLAELGPDYQWQPDPEDGEDDIKKLLEEAKEALPRDQPAKRPEDKKRKDKTPQGNPLTRDLDMSAFDLNDGDATDGRKDENERLVDESREARDIVARLLDEVNLERQNEPQTQEAQLDAPSDQKEEGEDDEGLSLPSAPSTLPEPTTEPSKKSLDFESDIAARMAALSGLSTNSLGLPSAPTFKPVDKPVKGVMRKYTDEEIDGWCIICQDDATVKCLGCDGDLYCAMCWKEGHIGPDVGFEEKGHKWTKFVKPK